MARSPAPTTNVPLARARAHWHHRQGLAAPVSGGLPEVIARTGWPRTLGGVDVYLAVRARVPGLRRAELDGAVERGELKVVPAVRGCIYLVPRAEVPLVLRVAEEQYRARGDRELEKVGVPLTEVAEIAEASIAVLAKGALSADALRRALPAGLVRSLGELGKKLGISSALPSALRHLEFEGRVERTLAGGRLDTERYEWRVPARNPFDGADVPDDPIDRIAVVARAFFRQAAPATLKDFAAWAAVSQRDAKAAMDRLPLVPVTVEGYARDACVLQDDLEALLHSPPSEPSYALLPFEDNYITYHGGPAPLVDPKFHSRPILPWGTNRPMTLKDARHISMRALLHGDRLAGFWEYDAETGGVVFGVFDGHGAGGRDAIADQAAGLGAFLRDDVGHARSFSLDTMEAVRERAALVRGMARCPVPVGT